MSSQDAAFIRSDGRRFIVPALGPEFPATYRIAILKHGQPSAETLYLTEEQDAEGRPVYRPVH